MAKKILVVLLTLHLLLKYATPQPFEAVSFTEDINFDYKDDAWSCGKLKCPANTFGCKIVKKTFEDDKKLLYQAYNCMDKNKNITIGDGNKIKLPQARKIHIVLDTFVGAHSTYRLHHSPVGNEYAEGVIAVDELNKFKKDFRGSINPYI